MCNFKQLLYRKPTTHRGKKALLKREPKLVENAKDTLCLRGKNTSQIVTDIMKDLVNIIVIFIFINVYVIIPKKWIKFLNHNINMYRTLFLQYSLKKPNVQMLQRKNDILPFEDVTPIEKFTSKYNASLFIMALHNKKRPQNLVMGRMYEHTLLDMIEFGVENFKGLKDFKVAKISSGIKPLLIFNGELFENNYEYGRIKNLLIDMFQREVVEKIRLQGLEHVLSFTAVENKILLRSYR